MEIIYGTEAGHVLPTETYEKTDMTDVYGLSEAPVSDTVPPRPELEELLQYYSEAGIMNVPSESELPEETDEKILAKKFVEGSIKAKYLLGNRSWRNYIDLDEYIDNVYLKNFIECRLNEYQDNGRECFNRSTFRLLPNEVVQQKQVNDILYLEVAYISQYLYENKYANEIAWIDDWSYHCWIGIRGGKIVDQYMFVFIDNVIPIFNDGSIDPSEPPSRNLWDNMEDIEKIYEIYGIEMI